VVGSQRARGGMRILMHGSCPQAEFLTWRHDAAQKCSGRFFRKFNSL
jgi:hypothetical protein